MTTAELIAGAVDLIEATAPVLSAVLGFVVGLELVHFAVDLVRGR